MSESLTPRQAAHHAVAGALRGEQVEAVAARGVSTSIRAYDAEVESFTSATTAALGVRVIVDGRQGFASVGTFAADAIDESVRQARDNATFAEPDEWVGLVEPDGVEAPDLSLVHERFDELSVDARIETALEVERRVVAADPRITGVRRSGYSDSAATSAIVSSTGVDVETSATRASLSVLALASEGDTATGFGFDMARAGVDLDVDRVVDDAVDRVLGALGATKPPTERLTIVCEPRMTAALLGIVAAMLSGGRVVKGRTPFAGRLGEPIAAPRLTLYDEPIDPESFGATLYDGEGLASRRLDLVRRGELLAFAHDGYTGRRTGTGTTASAVRGARSTPTPGVRALHVEPGERSHEAIVASIGTGLLVRSMNGLHSGVNAVSGDFSAGIEGHMIRDGEIAEPVREATIASSIQRLLLDVVEVGADLDRRSGATVAPTLVIDDVTLSGT